MLDYLGVESLLSSDERQIGATARHFLEENALPIIGQAWEEGRFPSELIRPLGEMGFLGANLPREYGCAGVSSNGYGRIMYELERIDSGLRSFVSVQGSLVMYPIFAYGSEEQRRTYLPKLATGEIIGCFGLTEATGGSDPAAMKTCARRAGGDWIIDGAKMWITNGNIAHIAIVWAKGDDGKIHGFIVPTDAPGFAAHPIKHKFSLRASVTSELILDGVRVPESLRLPTAVGLKAALGCLTQARYGIAWGAMGALEAVYSESLTYAKSRNTFGRPIASRQLVQGKLVDMLADHSRGLLLAWRLGCLKEEGKLGYGAVSMGKRDNVRAALRHARVAREILGGAGISAEHQTIRHMLNLETVDTYEGTHDIHTLILGREITGFDALQ